MDLATPAIGKATARESESPVVNISMVKFRNWLRVSKDDRELYARTKRNLAEVEWKCTQNYADAKSEVIEEIMSRARRTTGT